MREMKPKSYRYRCKWCNEEFEKENKHSAKLSALWHNTREHDDVILKFAEYGYLNKYLIEQVKEVKK